MIEQASVNHHYRDHPARERFGLESYVSVPVILPDGTYFGNLFAFDAASVRISAGALDMFTQFSALIAMALGQETSRETAEISLREERAAGELRERFIAILGHDLRNPLQAIFATSDLLTRQSSDPAVVDMATRIKANARRMSSLVDDVIDFARGRLGGGIGLRLSEIENINAGLTSVVRELQDGQPDRRIDHSFRVDRMVRCDIGRVQQVASNLIGNALMHGTRGTAIKVAAYADEHDLVLEVWNEGEPISADHVTKIFEPFWRRDSSARREGLGLGLHICAQIVRAHGGVLSVISSKEDGTTFTARIPLHLLSGSAA